MSTLPLIISALFVLHAGNHSCSRLACFSILPSLFTSVANVVCLSLPSSIIPLIDSETGDERILDCSINRSQSTLPSILQWHRSTNNYSNPIASQFNNYPVHVDEFHLDRYELLANGSLRIQHIQLTDNDTFECRRIVIDRGLLDIEEKTYVTLRVNGTSFEAENREKANPPSVVALVLERPRFINQSNPIEIATHYSIVNFICDIYGVPSPSITWHKLVDKGKQVRVEEEWQLLLANSPRYVLDDVFGETTFARRSAALSHFRLD